MLLPFICMDKLLVIIKIFVIEVLFFKKKKKYLCKILPIKDNITRRKVFLILL